MKGKARGIQKIKQAAACILALTMCLSAPMTTLADVKEADSKTIKLSKIVGTVNVNKGAKAVPKVTEGMRMHDGHTVMTDKESNAFFELDASKYIKMDQISKVKVQKSKNTNKIMVESGTVFFNVTKPLADGETMEIKTPTITMGVRGTSGVVGFRESEEAERQLFIATVQIYTGLGMVSVADDVSGETVVYPVEPGTQIEIRTNVSTGAQAVEAGKLDLSGMNIPVVAAEELLQNPELREVIEATTQIKITEATVAQKKAEEKAIVEAKVEAVNKAVEAVKEQNKIYEVIDTSKDKTHSGPSKPEPTEPAPTEPAPTEPAPTEPAPTEPAPTEPAPTEPEPELSGMLTGNVTEVELLDAFLTYDRVVLKNGKIELKKKTLIPAGKFLVLEENGTLDLNGFDMELRGEIINNSPNSIRLGNHMLLLEGSGRLVNSGAITAENGKIQVNGAQAYIKNGAGQTIPHIAIGATGALLIENESGAPQPGKISILSGDGAAKVRFKNTQNSSASNYGGGDSFKDAFNTVQEHVTFEEEYNWDISGWKLNMPENLIYAKDYKGHLTARIEDAFTSGATTFTVVCGGTGIPDVLEKDLTVPEGKTLIVLGASGSLMLDSTNIGLTNYGKIQIGTAEKTGAVEESGEQPGNITNEGVITVVNGRLTIHDKGDDFSTALGGKVAISTQGTLKVYSGSGAGPYWGHISGQLLFAAGSTIDLNSSNPETSTYLNLLEGATAIDRGYKISKNNEDSEFVDSRVFEGVGTASVPYLIKSETDLYKLQKVVASTDPGDAKYRKAHYRLERDIVLDSTVEWVPIGTEAQPFEGTFDGANCTITNVHTTSAQASDVGFFGVIKGATIENLFLEAVDMKGNTNVGGIAGQADMNSTGSNRSFISKCNVAGTISGGSYTGGIVGLLKASTVNQCVNKASITANDNTGGITGSMQTSAIISECFNRGAIAGGDNTGGLVGSAIGSGIAESYNEGSVKGKANTGGIIGSLQAHAASTAQGVRHTYNRGSVSGDSKVGGIVGYVPNNSDTSGTTKITIIKNTLLGTVSSGSRIIGQFGGTNSTSGGFDIRENYGVGEATGNNATCNGSNASNFNSTFWRSTIEFKPEFWEVNDGGDAAAQVIPTLKNAPEEQNPEFVFKRRRSAGVIEIRVSDNQDAIATAIENGFEEGDLVVLRFEENESVDLEKDLTIPEDKILKIIGTSLKDKKKSAGLNVPSGITLTNHGTIKIGTEYEEGLPTEAGALSQGTLGKNSIVNHGLIDVKQGVFRISAAAEDNSGIGGEVIVGQEMEADSMAEELEASLMVYSGNRWDKVYWGKIAGDLTIHDSGKIDLFHTDPQITVNLLLLEGASITESGEACIYKNEGSLSDVIFEGDLPEETLPEEVLPEETLPEETLPEETLPEETLPEETLPEETLPEETLPEETLPEETLPEESLPGEKPDPVLPEEGQQEDVTTVEPPVAKDEEDAVEGGDDSEEDGSGGDTAGEDDTVADENILDSDTSNEK